MKPLFCITQVKSAYTGWTWDFGKIVLPLTVGFRCSTLGNVLCQDSGLSQSYTLIIMHLHAVPIPASGPGRMPAIMKVS